MAGFRGLPNIPFDFRQVAEIARLAIRGKLNATKAVTLTANQATTTLTDERLSGSSFIGFSPLTANAAAEIGAGTLYISARGDGTATLTHANNAQTDRDFTILIIG